MQTTLRLPDELYNEAKARAGKEGISLTQFLVQAIRLRLGKPLNKSEKWIIPTSSAHAELSEAETMAFVEAALKTDSEDDSELLLQINRKRKR